MRKETAVPSGDPTDIPHLSLSLHKSPLIVVSNRGPFEHQRDEQGALVRRPTGGGVAIALSSMTERQNLTWVVGAVSQADRDLVSLGLSDFSLNNGHRLRFVGASPSSYELFYGVFCNPILWFLQHSLWHLLEGRPNLQPDIFDAWNNGYLPLNAAFAEAVIDEVRRAKGKARVMLHDYHLYAAPLFIRDRCPGVQLQHFTHIPWPGPETWSVLPASIVESICEGMLANDSVSFQTEQSKHEFLRTCRAYLPAVSVDRAETSIVYRGRAVNVFSNPISVDVFDLRRKIASPEVGMYGSRLAADDGMLTIVRVDRLDPSKNVLTGFKAYRLLLERHPEWRGRVRFLAFLVPSREVIPEYREYREKVFALVDEINALYGTNRWRPITVYHEENRPQALAGLSLYDVLLANSLADGMNLVAKEGPIVNRRDGAVVLSTSVGAYHQLREAVLGVEATDIQGTAAALEQALRMAPEERHERARALRHAVGRHDITAWVSTQMAEFKRAESKPVLRPARAEGKRWNLLRAAFARRAFQFASAATAVSIFGFGVFAVSTSASALPGDWQYPIKRTVEDVRYTLTFSESGKKQLNIEFAETRVSEIQQLADKGRPIGEGPLRDVTNQMDSLVGRLDNGQLDVSDAQKVQELAQQQQDILKNVAPMVKIEASDELVKAKIVSTDALLLANDYVMNPPGLAETASVASVVKTATRVAGRSTATPVRPKVTPTPAIIIVPLQRPDEAGIAWSLARMGDLSLEVPSESSGWLLTTGPDPALGVPLAVQITNADASATVLINPATGDVHWRQLFPDGSLREYKVRTSTGGITSQASDVELAAFYAANAAIVSHIAGSISVEQPPTPTPSRTATGTPEVTIAARTATPSTILIP